MLLWKKTNNFAVGLMTINCHYPDFRAYRKGTRSHFGICKTWERFFIMSREPGLKTFPLAPLSAQSLGKGELFLISDGTAKK